MQSHMAIYIQWAPWAPHTRTHTHTHTHARAGETKHTHTLCGILSLFLAQILVQVVVVAAVELVGFHVVFRYNFFFLVFLFHIFLVLEQIYVLDKSSY